MKVTAVEIEDALDRLADIMVFMGDKGHIYLPIYERLEKEFEQLRSTENKMDAVKARAEQSKLRSKQKKKTDMPQITITEITDCRLEWQSQGIQRSGLPEGHPDKFFGVWRDKQLLFLCPDHTDALMFATLKADQDSTSIVDLSTHEMRLAGEDDWVPCPTTTAS